MGKFARGVIRYRVFILLVVASVTIGFSTALPKLFADDDVMQFLPANDPEVQLFRRVNERFGGLDVAIVGLESKDLFSAKRLHQIRQLTRHIGEVEGVFDVLSFTEVPNPVPGPFGLTVEPLVGQVPTDPTEIAELKKKVLANDNAVGNLISEDGHAAMILCFLGGDRPPMHVAADIKKAAASIWTGEGIYFGGNPFIRMFVAGGTNEDLKKLTPVVAIVVLIVTFLLFRKPIGVLLSLGVVGIALVWLMGALALRDKGITITGSALPTLMLAIGGAYGIHILTAYFSGKAKTVNGRIVEAIESVGAPVAVSAATTCAGFISFLAMDVRPMQEFGASIAIGVAVTGLLALTVIPAVLSFGKKVPSSLGAAMLAKPLGKIGGWAAAHRKWAIAGAVVLGIASLDGIQRVAPDATLKSFFKDGSEPDEANKFLDRHFGGSVYVQIFFEGDMRSPFVLAEMRKLVEYLHDRDEVVQVSSIIDPLVMMSEAMGGRADLPLNRDRTRSLFPFLEGTAAIDQVISPQKDAGLIQIRMKSLEPDDINHAIDELKAFVDAEIPPGVVAVNVATLPDIDKAARTEQMNTIVAKRVVRLINAYPGLGISPKDEAQTIAQITGVLASKPTTRILEPGMDLTVAITKVVEEHMLGDGVPFVEPVPGESDEEILREWTDRVALTAEQIVAIAGQPLTLETVKSAINKALPRTSERDPEGLVLTADMIASGLAMSYNSVRAGRLVDPVLQAADITDASEELKTRILWALTDLGAPAFGFPDNTEKASKITAAVTGQPIINVAFCNSTIRNQFKSLIVAFIILSFILMVSFRSVSTSAKALVPSMFMLAGAVGIMGAAAIPLDISTSMIAAIALGIGVDYAIHFLWRRRRRGESLAVTTAKVGPSIASNAVQVSAGFAVLALSDMVPMQRFGLLVAVTMILSAVATFILLPALRAEGREIAEEEANGT
ncbi:MAG: MMPL family transporter [Proteobacteria bacterium]|nr:MMPL family transporter [Pseudomonadota bacterium]